MHDLRAFGCGQCLPCRIQKRRLWTNRLLLESKSHSNNSFITLTYDDEKIPDNHPVRLNGSLHRRDITLFLKKLRNKIQFRYYGIGEYGDETQRPHYHIAMFGYPQCLYGRSTYPLKRKNCCPVCDLIRDTWGNGNILIDEFNETTAQYVCGYVTKKMTNPNNQRVREYLNGRYKEFPFMSLKPGIGALAVDKIVDALETPEGLTILESTNDVPHTLNLGKRTLPLGKYLRKKIREKYGVWSDEELFKLQKNHAQEMQELYEEARTLKENPSLSQNEILKKQSAQRIATLEAKNKIFTKRSTL